MRRRVHARARIADAPSCQPSSAATPMPLHGDREKSCGPSDQPLTQLTFWFESKQRVPRNGMNGPCWWCASRVQRFKILRRKESMPQSVPACRRAHNYVRRHDETIEYPKIDLFGSIVCGIEAVYPPRNRRGLCALVRSDSIPIRCGHTVGRPVPGRVEPE